MLQIEAFNVQQATVHAQKADQSICMLYTFLVQESWMVIVTSLLMTAEYTPGADLTRRGPTLVNEDLLPHLCLCGVSYRKHIAEVVSAATALQR